MIFLFGSPFVNTTTSQYMYIVRVLNISIIQLFPFLYSITSSLKVMTISPFFNLHITTALLFIKVLLIALTIVLDILLKERIFRLGYEGFSIVSGQNDYIWLAYTTIRSLIIYTCYYDIRPHRLYWLDCHCDYFYHCRYYSTISFIISSIISYNIFYIFQLNCSNSSFINDFIITLISIWTISLISFYNYLYIITASLLQPYISIGMTILIGYL